MLRIHLYYLLILLGPKVLYKEKEVRLLRIKVVHC